MQTKKCKKCKSPKSLEEFYKDSRNKDGYWGTCIDCSLKRGKKYKEDNKEAVDDYTKKYRKDNKEKVKKWGKDWHERNKEYVAKKSKEYYKENEERLKEVAKIWRDENKERIEEKRKVWQGENKERVAKKAKAYKVINKEAISTYARKYRKERKEKDELYRLRINISKRISASFKVKGFKKGSLARLILGCSYEEFHTHLNDNPYGFKVDDKGLDLDHTTPISKATTEEEVLKLNHYTNFQLLPRLYNQNIKKDNPWSPKHFKEWLKNQC